MNWPEILALGAALLIIAIVAVYFLKRWSKEPDWTSKITPPMPPKDMQTEEMKPTEPPPIVVKKPPVKK